MPFLVSTLVLGAGYRSALEEPRMNVNGREFIAHPSFACICVHSRLTSAALSDSFSTTNDTNRTNVQKSIFVAFVYFVVSLPVL